jgi:2-polyprenyl-3-methyl-5-hydroxy-6-metoxy-1,4-benzoquinol methylase
MILSGLVGSNKKVLDVGCSEGFLADCSAGNKNVFYGIDCDKSALQIAKSKYHKIFEADLNAVGQLPELPADFDIVVFADILEHLRDPSVVLKHFINTSLKKGGTVLISLPNVAHYSVRASLLFGGFVYTDSGILDKGHLHLYTLLTAKRFVESAGLKVRSVHFSSNIFGPLIRILPMLGPILGFNLILECQRY